jgi:hypothetical protein
MHPLFDKPILQNPKGNHHQRRRKEIHHLLDLRHWLELSPSHKRGQGKV